MRTDSQDPVVLGRSLDPPHIGTRATWERHGVSRRMFYDGRLRRLGRGLWTSRDVGALSCFEVVPLLASVLPSDAVIGGWAAAMIHQTRDCGPTMARSAAFRGKHVTGEVVPIYMSRGTHKLPGGFVTLRVNLAADEILERDGLRFTSPSRTAYDMARFAPSLSEAVGILDCFAFDGNQQPVSMAEVRLLMSQHPKARGNPLVSRAVGLASTRSRSFPESTIRVGWIRGAGIAADQILINAMLQLPNERAREMDFVDLSSGLIGEYDGLHHADAATRSADARKSDLIDRAGLGLVRYTAAELRLSAAAFAALTNERRLHSIARGGDYVVRQLHQFGYLVERPLTIY